MKTKLLATIVAVALGRTALADPTIKLGVVNIDSGPLAVVGSIINDGATFAVEQLNAEGGALGRKYELVVQNHQGTSATALAAVQKLVEQRGVSFFTGLTLSSHALAISSKLNGLNAIFVDATGSTDDLTGKSCHRNYFRVCVTDSMHMKNFDEVAGQKGVMAWDMLLADYALGHDVATLFGATVQKRGGRIGKTLFAPMSTTDFGSYVGQLLEKPSEGLLLLMPASAGVNLMKQQQPYKLLDRYKLVLSISTVNETVIGAHGDSSVGVWASQGYLWSMPSERNGAFVEAFVARFKRKPTYLDVDAYTAVEVIHQAILRARSTEVAAVRKALEGLKMTAIVGEVEMRAADHQLLRPLAAIQAVRAGEGRGEMVLRSVQPT